jgi:hypothetical protein
MQKGSEAAGDHRVGIKAIGIKASRCGVRESGGVRELWGVRGRCCDAGYSYREMELVVWVVARWRGRCLCGLQERG